MGVYVNTLNGMNTNGAGRSHLRGDPEEKNDVLYNEAGRTGMKPYMRYISRSLTRCIIGFLAVFCMSASAQDIPGWTLVWYDEFDGPDIDTSKWSHEVNGWGGGNNELQYYTARTNNSFIENGNLVIQALEENYSGWEYPPGGGNGDWVNRNYTSARLRTKNKGDWTYGRFEARMKLPYGQGLWPAFWMLPTDNVYGGWAASGEIDIMEIVGHEPDILHGTIHFHGEWPDNWSDGASWTLPSGDFSDDFHVFAIEWEEGEIRWYVDGILYSTKTWWDTTADAPFPAPFDELFHMLLNVAVGGEWPGPPDGTTVFPQRMTVDYVRVYTPDHNLIPCTNLFVNPGFESGVDGWELTLSDGSASASTDYVRSETHSLVIDSTGAVGWNSPHLSQTFPANPGDIFNVQGYMLNPVGSPISGSSFGLFKIEFRDHSGTALEPVLPVEIGTSATAPFYGAESTPFLTAGSATDTWIFSEAQAEAPAGTESVSFLLLNVNEPGNPGPMYFDDVQAVLLPEPAVPFALNASVAGGNIQISFPTENKACYEVVSKDSLTNSSWTSIETIIGDGSTNSVSYAATNAARFYRVFTH